MPHPVGKPSLWRASGYSRYSADTGDGKTVVDRARGQSLLSIDTRNRACRFERLLPVYVPLSFLLPKLLMNMKHDATDRFMRDSIRGCYCAERFLLLHYTMHHNRPLGSSNTVCGVFWPWTPVLHNNRRMASLSCLIYSKQTLHLLIQYPRWGKEEV